LIVDRDLWQEESFRFHPLVNTSTLVVSRHDLEKFLTGTGHEPTIVNVPD
jgi:Ala-tRNA(Pro) deacylase